ncbi:MAG: CbtA family protein [Candidatus Methylumidiphilus sp.]
MLNTTQHADQGEFPVSNAETIRADRIASALGVMLIGIVIIVFTPFAPMQAAHNATHDTRHAFIVPCHYADMFKQWLLASLVAGLLSGLVLSAFQFLQVIPIIQEAERYEVAAARHLSHDTEPVEAWSLQEGWERVTFTVAANVSMGVGLGFLLVGAYALRRRITPFRGFSWGLAGLFLCFT